MIYTSFYGNKKISNDLCVPVGISWGGCRFKLSYKVEARLRELMPPRDLPVDLWQAERAYRAHLDSIGAQKIRALFPKDRPVVLLCFEPSHDACHRHWFARWWEEQTGETVCELSS